MGEERAGSGFGAWYDLKQGEEGDLWHRTLIDPGLRAALGDLPEGTRLLDVGCGNGYLARRLARAGVRVVGVDASSELIALAQARETRERLGIEYLHRDAADLEGLSDSAFDVALANMSLMDMERTAEVLRELARVTRDRGRLVFSISHPCFDVDTRSAWSVEVLGGPDEPPRVFRKVADYRDPHSDEYLWFDSEGRPVARTTGYHRPLSWYAHALRTAGWVIVDLVEPRPLPEFVGRRIAREWLEKIPLHLVVDARREGRPWP